MLDRISENMAYLLKWGKYGSTNEAGSTKMGYYVIKYLSEPHTLKEYQTTHGQVIKEGKPVFKA